MLNIVRNISNMLSPAPRRPTAYSDETKVAFRQLIGSCMWYENRAKVFTRISLNNFRTNYGWAADELATAGLVYETMGDFIHAYIRADTTNEYNYLLTTEPRARSDWLLRLRELEGLQELNPGDDEQPPDEIFHDSREQPDEEEIGNRPRNRLPDAFQYQGGPTRLVNVQELNTPQQQGELRSQQPTGQQQINAATQESPTIQQLRREIAVLTERARLDAIENERERVNQYNQFYKSAKTPILQQNLKWDVSKLDTGFNNLQSSYVNSSILTHSSSEKVTDEGKPKSKSSASSKHSKIPSSDSSDSSSSSSSDSSSSSTSSSSSESDSGSESDDQRQRRKKKKKKKSNFESDFIKALQLNAATDGDNIPTLTDSNKTPAKWFRHFDKRAKLKAWGNDVKAIKVVEFLKGEAEGVYLSMKRKDKADYNAIKKKLIKKLTPEDAPERALKAFNEAAQRIDETATSYGRRLKRLAKDAGVKKEKRVVDRFVKSVLKDTRDKLASHANPKSVSKAARMAKQIENRREDNETMTINNINSSKSSKPRNEAVVPQNPVTYQQDQGVSKTRPQVTFGATNYYPPQTNYRDSHVQAPSGGSRDIRLNGYEGTTATYTPARSQHLPYHQQYGTQDARGQGYSSPQQGSSRNSSQSVRSEVSCYNCGQPGHYKSQCTVPCLVCSKTGHSAKNCPNLTNQKNL